MIFFVLHERCSALTDFKVFLLVSAMEFSWQLQTQTTPIFSHQMIIECLYSAGLGVEQPDRLLLGFEIVDKRDLQCCIF